MKPIINLSIAALLSLGVVACGGSGGASNAAQPLPKDHIDYIDLNDTTEKTVTLEDRKQHAEKKKHTTLSALRQDGFVFLMGHPNDEKSLTPVDYKEKLSQLDAKYEGDVFIALNENQNTQVEKRKVLFNLKQDKISGHSVKRQDINDIQVVFKESNVTNLTQDTVPYLGFFGDAEVMKEQKLYSKAVYFGTFAGKEAEEISGAFIDNPATDADTQPKVSGGFIATREEAPAKP